MKFLLAIMMCSGLVSAGCKRPPKDAATPASAAATTAARPDDVLKIDGETFPFPQVLLRLRDTGGSVNALMRTPPTEGGAANAIYFDLNLDDIDGPDAICFSEWHYQADDNSDRSDSLNGIFLHGRTVVLQPKDVQIGFGADGEQLRATIVGEFFRYDDPDSEKPTKTVAVAGRVLLKREEH